MACLHAKPCIVSGSWRTSMQSRTGSTHVGAVPALMPARHNQCSFLQTESWRLVSSSGTQYIVPSAAAWDASLARAEHGASEQAAHHGTFSRGGVLAQKGFSFCARVQPRPATYHFTFSTYIITFNIHT